MRNKPIWEKKKVTVLAGLAVAMALLFCLAMSVQAADMGEIRSGETRTGNIAYNGQTDSFTFYGNASQVVIISMSRESGGLNPCIYLYAPNGTLEVSASALYGPYPHYKHALLKDHLLEQSGLYTIVVKDCEGDDTGNYGLSLVLIPGATTSHQDPDGGPIASGETKIGAISERADTDVLSFYGNASQVVIISMSRESGGLNPCIYLYAPNGTLEVSASALYGPYPHYEHALLNHLLEQLGLYTIVVKDCEGDDTGNYSLSLVLIPGATTSHQDPDGGPIASGETETGAISERADTDVLSFYGNASQGVVISMSRESGGLNPCIYLYAPNGTLEVSASALYGPYPHYEHALLNHLLEQSGLYTIVVKDCEGDDTGNYSLSFTKIPATLPPGIYNPFPANGVTITNLNQSFRWDAVRGATDYNLYFGEDIITPLKKIGKNLSSPEMPFSEMEWDKVYYWHVEAHIPNGTIQGPYWWFKVVSEQINPKSDIHVYKNELLYLSISDAHINHSEIYNFTTIWDADMWEMKNLDNVTYTITTPKNLTYIDNWELYQNGTDKSFISPPTIEGEN